MRSDEGNVTKYECQWRSDEGNVEGDDDSVDLKHEKHRRMGDM